MINPDREMILSEIRRVAKEADTDTLARSVFIRESGISEHHILKFFDCWNDAIEAAGLTPVLIRRIDDEVLLQEMLRVFIDNGGVCSSRVKFDKLCRYGVDTYKKHFGKWNSILLAFREWLVESGEDFPYLDQLPQEGTVNRPAKTEGKKAPVTSYSPAGSTRYGTFLNFRGLQHAPTNEQGVVFLFGMVCSDLGFAVEAVKTGYPDCDAKRRINRQQDQWERVRVEFEFKSSEFKNHGHDPSNCDLIVCWIDDWQECPLEVLELKTAIEDLPD